MAAKTIEDLFFADDLDALGAASAATATRNAGTHEEVDEIRSQVLALLERAGAS